MKDKKSSNKNKAAKTKRHNKFNLLDFLSDMNEKQKRVFTCVFMSIVAYPFVVYVLLLIAPLVKEFSSYKFDRMLAHPDIIYTCPMSLPTVLVGSLFYLLIVAYIIMDVTSKNFRPGTDHGDARWGSVKDIDRRYRDEDPNYNRIVSNRLSISLSDKKHGLNNHMVVIGGSGAGKSRFSCIPNLMEMSGSYIVLDSKRELLRTTGEMFRQNGYVVKVLNLIDPTQSDFFNPFEYVRTDEDIIKIAHNLMKNTSENGTSKGDDQFFEDMAEYLLIALMYAVYYEGLPGEKNFGTVLDLFHELEFREEDESFKSTLHYFFMKLEQDKPNHPALFYWHGAINCAGKTQKSIQVSLERHLAKFNAKAIRNLVSYDNLELHELGERKTVLFACIPDNDNTFNFIVSQLYSTLFDVLYYQADHKHFNEGQRLPVPVSFLMDEFYNVAVPENFTNIIGTCRSRNIFLTVYLQDREQLTARFEKENKIVFSQFDIFLYLGGNSQETMEFISKALGEETIDSRSYGESVGTSSSSSKNDSSISIALMSIAQLRRMKKSKCLILVKGEDPIIDNKYDSLHHPNVDQTQLKTAPKDLKEFVVHQSTGLDLSTITDNDELQKYKIRDVDYSQVDEIEEYSAATWLMKKGVSI